MTTEITEAVRERYGSVATSGLSSDQAGVRAVAATRDEIGRILLAAFSPLGVAPGPDGSRERETYRVDPLPLTTRRRKMTFRFEVSGAAEMDLSGNRERGGTEWR